MIDTVVLNSPFLDEYIASKIESISIVRSGIDFQVGELLYQFTTKELRGSWESSIRLQIKREMWVSEKDINTKKLITYKKECRPYLQVECSLHKFFLGHNCFGGSDDIQNQVLLLISFIENQFDIELPDYLEFTISRIDYARVYKLDSNDIDSFFMGFSDVYYPRRKVIKYGKEGLYFPGTHTTLKLYNKYIEFLKHDRKRISSLLDKEDMLKLLDKINGILRIELEVKSRKLKHIYNNELPTVKQLDINDLKQQYDIELKRIFKIGENNMRIVNKSRDVESRLYDFYGTKSNIYLGTWYRLTVNGYENVKKSMSESTFYRHIDMLKNAGVTWNFSDVKLEESNVIHFVFNPLETNLELKEDLIFKTA